MSEYETQDPPKKEPPLALAWRLYRENVIPRDAGRAQLVEMRRAFYAGAWSLLQAMMTQVSDPAVSEDEGVRIMETLHTEIQVFEALVKAGRA